LSKKATADQATIARLVQSITDLINEIEEHNQQAAYASAVEEKTARIKEVSERIGKELLLTS
jgi:methyl-accepting chemotaxis protein